MEGVVELFERPFVVTDAVAQSINLRKIKQNGWDVPQQEEESVEEEGHLLLARRASRP